jgi:hypothetical protein
MKSDLPIVFGQIKLNSKGGDSLSEAAMCIIYSDVEQPFVPSLRIRLESYIWLKTRENVARMC